MEHHVSPATSRTHTDVLDDFYAAEVRYLAAGGPKRGASFAEMARCFHPQAVMRQGPSVPFPGEWVGLAEVERFFDILSDTWAAAEGMEVTYFVGDDGVAVSMHVNLTSRATGRSLDSHLGQFITFEDGLIRDFTVFYLDPVAISRVCGL
jgi:ketosteroid isomerase-like protein